MNTGDTAWMLTATALVLLMTLPGLALFYGGMVRKKNVLATLMQSFTICCLCSVLWMVAGYSLAFADGNDFVGGTSKLMLAGIGPESLSGTIPEALFVAFQMTFAIITPALITGAFAERMKFGPMMVFSGLWLVLVYAPICHWVWGGGFLGGDGVLDYAGGTVVHINAGVAGLVAAIVLGPRKGFGKVALQPHNLVLTVIGACMLWVGWYGFNAGSALGANGSAAMALLVTHIAAAAAGLAWLATEWLLHKRPSVLGIVTGAVGGLVAITPAAGFVNPSGALAIGLIAGVCCYFGATALKNRLGYDDSLDCFGVHGVGGLVGAVLTGVFASEAVGGVAGGLEGNWGQVGIQVWGIAATVGYAVVVTYAILKAIDLTVGLRVDEESESRGLDIAVHGEAVQ